MAKPPRPLKSDEQREAERRRKEFADKLELIVENLGEDNFVSAVKGYKPDITKEELQEWLCGFAPPCARSAGFINDPLEVFFGLLEFFFAELLALGSDQILEALGKSRHRGFWLLGRCRHGRTFPGTRVLVTHIV